MGQWLAPILGVVVVGVIIELVSKESRLGKFIRSIYAFFVLFVIIQPLPKLFNNLDFFTSDSLPVNSALVTELTQSRRQAQIAQTLAQLGYPDALVSVQDNAVYITLGRSVTAAELDAIKKQIGTEGVYII